MAVSLTSEQLSWLKRIHVLGLDAGVLLLWLFSFCFRLDSDWAGDSADGRRASLVQAANAWRLLDASSQEFALPSEESHARRQSHSPTTEYAFNYH